MNFTTTVGLPGRVSDKRGAKKFAHFAEPPVSENGMVHSIVLPEKSTAADAGSAVTATMPATQLALITERASFFIKNVMFFSQKL